MVKTMGLTLFQHLCFSRIRWPEIKGGAIPNDCGASSSRARYPEGILTVFYRPRIHSYRRPTNIPGNWTDW
jgi:hypothetical protein